MNPDRDVADTSSNEAAPQPAEVARLAVRLLSSGEELTSDPKRVAEAVTAARLLLKEVGSKPREHASDLFSAGAVMSYKEIADTFEENSWLELKNPNTVASRINEILGELHRDIERRRCFLSSTFRAKRHRMDPEDAETEARRTLRDLVGRLGLAQEPGEALEEIVSDAWSRILESVLKQAGDARIRFERTRLHTAEHFNAICVDFDYQSFSAKLARMPELDSSGFLDVMLYLSGSVRTVLEEGMPPDDEMDRLIAVNLWAELLFPGDRLLARPFAEFLQMPDASKASPQERLETFDRGMRRMASILAALKLRELREKLTMPDRSPNQEPAPADPAEAIQEAATMSRAARTDSLLEAIEGIRKSWVAVSEDDRRKLDDASITDPWILLGNLNRYFSEGQYRATLRMPFDGSAVETKALAVYSRNIDSLAREIRELETLALRLRAEFDPSGILQLLDMEKKQLRDLGAILEAPDGGGLDERVKNGRGLLRPAPSSTKRWGRIRPHLLFAYARDRELMEGQLTKSL